MSSIGYEIGRTTIKRILADHGIEPAPARGWRMRWSTFLKALWGAIAGMDFFTVEVLNFRGLLRYFVLFVIDLKTLGGGNRRADRACGRTVNEADGAEPDRCW